MLFSQSGLISRITHFLGLPPDPGSFPPLVNDPWGFGIIAEYVWKETVFIGVVVLAALSGSTRDFEDLARTLGAGWWQRFRHVTLPFIMPGVMATSIIVFAFSFGSYEVPYLLGQPYPAVLPVMAYLKYTNVDLAARSEARRSTSSSPPVVILVLVYMRLNSRFVRASDERSFTGGAGPTGSVVIRRAS